MRETKKSICNGQYSDVRLFSSDSQRLLCQTRSRRRPNPTDYGNRRFAASSRHDIMTETTRMENPSKSFDVFEFREEELTEMAEKMIASEFVNSHSLSAENDAEKMPELSNVLHADFNSCERATETKSDIKSRIYYSNVEHGSSSSLGVTLQTEDHSNNVFPVSSCSVKAICLGSDAVNRMTEKSSSYISNNNASSDGPSSDNCFGGWDLDDERVGIVFYSDHLVYQGTQYIDSMVSFSKSCVEARSKTIHGDEETFHIRLEIDDIVKIESQWSVQFKAGIINICFIQRDAARVEFDTIHDASELQHLKFPTIESNWYQKCEAIESLDARYKALWNVLLDTGIEKCSSLPKREDWMLTRSYIPNFDGPFEEVIYPKGDPDAVSISKRDVDLLLPDTFVNDTIIDFYIKYLKTRQNVDERTKFHFFNSFFFRKLADMDKDPSSAFDGKAAFQRVRKWTRKVNLLEKDFILIPVNYNLHWSLIVICYFGEVASYKDGDHESGRVPCILHMDSLRGTHSGLKDLIQSYLWEEWKERQNGAYEEYLHSKFRNLKFVPLELPQQQNSYDCGLFLLHYVERFLEEVPANFSICKITPSSKFLEADWFPPAEPSIKRTHIERLISDLLDSKSEECPPSGGCGIHCSPEELNTAHVEDAIQFSVKSSPLGDCHESSLFQVGQGIELTLLPTSARNTQCTSPSGLVLKDLFKQVPAPESFTDAPWEAGESRASLYEFKSHAPLIEEEVNASDCFVTRELAEHVFRHPDVITPESPGFPNGITPEAPRLPNSSEDYRSDAVYHPTSGDVDSTPLTSGAVHDAEGGVDMSEPATHDCLLTRNFSDELNVVECDGGIGQESDEQPSPKRMRIDNSHNLAQDLNF